MPRRKKPLMFKVPLIFAISGDNYQEAACRVISWLNDCRIKQLPSNVIRSESGVGGDITPKKDGTRTLKLPGVQGEKLPPTPNDPPEDDEDDIEDDDLEDDDYDDDEEGDDDLDIEECEYCEDEDCDGSCED